MTDEELQAIRERIAKRTAQEKDEAELKLARERKFLEEYLREVKSPWYTRIDWLEVALCILMVEAMIITALVGLIVFKHLIS